MAETKDDLRVREILATVKPLAAEFYRLTGKPLGVTGEVAEYVAAELLGLELASARQAGYDAIRRSPGHEEYVQIKGRAYASDRGLGQRIGTLKASAKCDVVLLVLLDNATLEAREILETSFASVCELLAKPGSRARERGSLSVAEFRRVAKSIWSAPSN